MPRRTISASTSWDDIYNYIAYVEIALSLAADNGDKELAALVPPMRKLLARWETLDGERRSQKSALIRANALVGLRDAELDEVTTRLHNEVLIAAGLNRKAPLFTRLFPKPLSQVVNMALEAQLGVGRTLLHQLAQTDTPAPLRKAHEKPLKDSLAAGEAAIKNREAARATSQAMATQITSLREEANNALLTIEGNLKTLAGKRALGPGYVNAFFPSYRPITKQRAEPTPAPAPAAG